MAPSAGDLGLLENPFAVELLGSRVPARLAYLWTDGTPRVVPIWFHWTGSELVVCSPARAPKLKALEQNPAVSVTIDSSDWPYRVLSVRGTADVSWSDHVAPEYAAAAERYLGADAGRAWVEQIRSMPMGRVAITPQWVNLLDFEERFPSALSSS
jgi:PPOX class probable F420-dependent enzyme